MKIQFAVVLKDWDGDDMKEIDAKASKPGEPVVTRPLTLGGACRNALNMQENGLTLEEQVKRGNLAGAIHKAEKDVSPIDLTAEQVVLIKTQVGKVGYPPVVVAAIVPLLDPQDEAKAA